jgi:hypothetical protein
VPNLFRERETTLMKPEIFVRWVNPFYRQKKLFAA